MDWLGIGVLIIGIVFAILVIILLKPINKLASLLDSLQQTTDRLPEVLDDVSSQASTVLQSSNATLGNVNGQVREISPLFHVIGDAGKEAEKFTSAVLVKTATLKQQTVGAKEFVTSKKYEGLFGLLSFLFFLFQKRQEISDTMPKTKLNK
ncbi:DUF948 domain-containing protein [Sporosarcina sp. E16_8]|uniref:DUF948 domain-containing protein n=1 Tax=Sporosarcina sp. E16_8 TaxID=2789295 RepID=UPI001A937BEA|nr:DUF948 domain-containing protein [Sporosarcina sp. E16_8]MBO0589289.1 DUF948 domain-containing protein [Sporosarcina sp. E16_8]